jgi:hypothetical protein
LRQRLVILIALLSLSTLVGTDWPIAVRFQIDTLNYYFVALLLVSVPVVLFWISLGLRSWRRIAGASIAVLLIAVCLIPAYWAFTSAPQFGEPGTQILDVAELDGFVYKLYQTDCGAPCDFGLLLREEHNLPLGLKTVGNIWVKNHEESGSLKVYQHKISVLIGERVAYEYKP